MQRTSRHLLALSFLLALAGCGGESPPGAPATPAAADDATAAPESTAADAGVTMRYDCGNGNSVEVLQGDSARVRLADGSSVELDRVAGSAPPAYRSEAMLFAIGSDGAQLDRDEGESWSCTAD